MKITNAAIYDIIEATKKFSNAKGKTAFVLFRVLRKLQDEIKDCDDQKNKLIQEYGKEVEGGIAIPNDDKEAYEKFMAKFTPILLYQIDVDIPQLTDEEFDSLYEVDAPNATMNDYAIIDAFLVKKPEPEKKEEKADTEPDETKEAVAE